VPTAIRTTSGSCLAVEGVKSPKNWSCYEYHPPGRSKTVRTAVGRSIFPADGIGRTSKPAAGEGEQQIAGPDKTADETILPTDEAVVKQRPIIRGFSKRNQGASND
jgi:hypothetical protein